MKKFFEEPTLEVLKIQEMESITDNFVYESGADPDWTEQ